MTALPTQDTLQLQSSPHPDPSTRIQMGKERIATGPGMYQHSLFSPCSCSVDNGRDLKSQVASQNLAIWPGAGRAFGPGECTCPQYSVQETFCWTGAQPSSASSARGNGNGTYHSIGVPANKMLARILTDANPEGNLGTRLRPECGEDRQKSRGRLGTKNGKRNSRSQTS